MPRPFSDRARGRRSRSSLHGYCGSARIPPQRRKTDPAPGAPLHEAAPDCTEPGMVGAKFRWSLQGPCASRHVCLDPHRENAVVIHSEVDRVQVVERSHEEPRPAEQEHRQGHLNDDERSTDDSETPSTCRHFPGFAAPTRVARSAGARLNSSAVAIDTPAVKPGPGDRNATPAPPVRRSRPDANQERRGPRANSNPTPRAQ